MPKLDIKFGAMMASQQDSVVEQAQRLEELGFDYAAGGEHFMRGKGNPGHLIIPTLAVAAGATRRIRLISTILLIPLYHPVVLAKLVTTLDWASGGRFALGVGLGGEFPDEFELLGVSVKERGARANECLELLRRFWTEENVTHEGRFFSFRDVTLKPPCYQKPHVPIWVSGRQEAAMRRAAKYGDGWLPYLYNPERYKESVARIRQMAEQEGRDLTGFQWGYHGFITIYDTKEEAIGVAVERLARYRHKDPRSVAERYYIVGSPKDCIRRIEQYLDAGARTFTFLWDCRPEDIRRHMEITARQIIPYFKG